MPVHCTQARDVVFAFCSCFVCEFDSQRPPGGSGSCLLWDHRRPVRGASSPRGHGRGLGACSRPVPPALPTGAWRPWATTTQARGSRSPLRVRHRSTSGRRPARLSEPPPRSARRLRRRRQPEHGRVPDRSGFLASGSPGAEVVLMASATDAELACNRSRNSGRPDSARRGDSGVGCDRCRDCVALLGVRTLAGPVPPFASGPDLRGLKFRRAATLGAEGGSSCWSRYGSTGGGRSC